MTQSKLNKFLQKHNTTNNENITNSFIISQSYYYKNMDDFEEMTKVISILKTYKVDNIIIPSVIIIYALKNKEFDYEIIKKKFCKDISIVIKKLLDIEYLYSIDINKLSNNQYVENLIHMTIGITNDTRIFLYKLIQQLIILKHSKYSEHKKQTALIVNKFYVPLSSRLGMGYIKNRLEDLSFLEINKEKYYEIYKFINLHTCNRDKSVKNIKNDITHILKTNNIKYLQISGRPKHIYSVYKKMLNRNIAQKEVYDQIAFRIILFNDSDCYEALSHLQREWEIIKNTYKDYISKPKSNGYQSIHVSLSNKDKIKFEIQIRTDRMHQHAEHGGASHWLYKEKLYNSNNSNKNLNNDIINKYLSKKFIFIFTPDKDIIKLPNGSTPIDVAYAIHTDIGHKCKGALINKKIVPLNHRISTGDIVEIITHNHYKPSRDWLNVDKKYIKSSRARTKLHAWFNKIDKEISIDKGKLIYEKEQKKAKDSLTMSEILQTTSYHSPDEVYMALSYNQFSSIPNNRVFKSTKVVHNNSFDEDSLLKNICYSKQLLMKRSKCCLPTEKDEIVGYISKNKGMYIHKANCINIKNKTFPYTERIIKLKWEP